MARLKSVTFVTALIMFGAALTTRPVAARTACAADSRTYGVVEIGGKGVKATLTRLVNSDEGGCDLDVQHEFDSLNVDPVVPKNEQAAVAAVLSQRDAINRWAKEQHIPVAGIYYVFSSGMADLREDPDAAVRAYWARLRTRIETETGTQSSIVSAPDEASLTFDGVVNNDLCPRRAQAALIDIGSSNIKGSYLVIDPKTLDPNAPNCTIPKTAPQHVTFEIPWGVRKLENDVSQRVEKVHGLTFAGELSATLEEKLAQPLRALPQQGKPNFALRRRVYMAGGIPYTLATLAHPDDPAAFVRLRASDIDDFYADALNHPECVSVAHYIDGTVPEANCRLKARLSHIVDSGRRDAVRADIKNILQNIFKTPQQLLTGAAILKVISDELHFKNRTVFFARQSKHSWMFGYLLQKLGSQSSLTRQHLPVDR